MKNNNFSKKRRVLTDRIGSTIRINSAITSVWNIISDPVGLPMWVEGVKNTVYASKRKSGVGTIREVIFNDSSTIEEHFVLWDRPYRASYIAVKGIPLELYFANYFLEKIDNKNTKVTWCSYVVSHKMQSREFSEFLAGLKDLYRKSLRNLKSKVEKEQVHSK